MITFEKTFCVVCFANYCRSPVAEVLLSEKYKDFNFISAGIEPKVDSTMDKRSIEYLSEKNIELKLHTPKKITNDMVNGCDEIFALDLFVLSQLNKLFPNNMHKFKMLNYQSPEIQIEDPYNYDKDNYFLVMKKINRVVEDLTIIA